MVLYWHIIEYQVDINMQQDRRRLSFATFSAEKEKFVFS